MTAPPLRSGVGSRGTAPEPRPKAPAPKSTEVSTVEQFTKFSTDAYGLERLLRGVQSILQLLIAYPTLHHHVHETLRETFLPFTFFLNLSAPPTSSNPFKPPPSHGPSPTLSETRSRIAIGRRFLRLFRFLEYFSASNTLFQSAFEHSSDKQKWTEAFSKSFNGLYYFLETVTFLDDLKVPGLSVCGKPLAKTLSVEAQRLWLFSLVLGIVSGWMKVQKITKQISTLKRQLNTIEKDGGATATTKEERKKELKKLKETKYKTLRRAVADVLDLPVPGSVIKWIPLPPGVVAVLMFFSTWLTGLEVWEKLGKEIATSKTMGGK